MDKQAELDAFLARCFAARVPVYKVCDQAQVARSTVSRWKLQPDSMTATTLGKLEDALTRIEAEKAA